MKFTATQTSDSSWSTEGHDDALIEDFASLTEAFQWCHDRGAKNWEFRPELGRIECEIPERDIRFEIEWD